MEPSLAIVLLICFSIMYASGTSASRGITGPLSTSDSCGSFAESKSKFHELESRLKSLSDAMVTFLADKKVLSERNAALEERVRELEQQEQQAQQEQANSEASPLESEKDGTPVHQVAQRRLLRSPTLEERVRHIERRWHAFPSDVRVDASGTLTANKVCVGHICLVPSGGGLQFREKVTKTVLMELKPRADDFLRVYNPNATHVVTVGTDGGLCLGVVCLVPDHTNLIFSHKTGKRPVVVWDVGADAQYMMKLLGPDSNTTFFFVDRAFSFGALNNVGAVGSLFAASIAGRQPGEEYRIGYDLLKLQYLSLDAAPGGTYSAMNMKYIRLCIGSTCLVASGDKMNLQRKYPETTVVELSHADTDNSMRVFQNDSAWFYVSKPDEVGMYNNVIRRPLGTMNANTFKTW